MMFLPDPNHRPNWPQRLRRAALVLVLVAIGFSALPGYRVAKRWRAHSIARSAERLLATEPQKALEKAQAALLLAPQDTVCLYAYARVTTKLGREEAFEYWRRCLGNNRPKGADREGLIDLALKFHRVDLAAALLSDALEQGSNSVPILRAAALCAELKNNRQVAIHFGKAWLEATPTNSQAQMFLARHLVASREATLAPTAAKLLWQVIYANVAESGSALDLLITLPTLTPEETKRALEILQQQPGDDLRRAFAVFDLQLRLEPERKNELVEEAIKRFQGNTPSMTALLTRWLSQKGEVQRILELISPSLAKSDHDLFLIRADALAASGKWTELETILDQPDAPLEPILTELYRARVAGELKKDRQKSYHWAQVQWLGAKNSSMLSYAAQYAERVGEKDQATQAYRRLTQDPAHARDAWLSLVRLTSAQPNTGSLLKLMSELVHTFPEDPAPRNDLAYLQLLTGENSSAASEMAKRLVQQYPDLLAYRTTLALAHLRARNAPAAKAAYDNLSVSWPATSPNMRAVYAAVLGANGEHENARKVAASIAPQQLRAEEQALVKPWF